MLRVRYRCCLEALLGLCARCAFGWCSGSTCLHNTCSDSLLGFALPSPSLLSLLPFLPRPRACVLEPPIPSSSISLITTTSLDSPYKAFRLLSSSSSYLPPTALHSILSCYLKFRFILVLYRDRTLTFFAKPTPSPPYPPTFIITLS